MLAASAAVATGEGDHVDFGHEVSAWLVGSDPGVKHSFAKEADSEDWTWLKVTRRHDECYIQCTSAQTDECIQ